MSLTRIHFDTDAEIGETIKKKKRVQIQLAYLGANIYNIKALDLSVKDLKDPKAIVCNRKVEFTVFKGNGRKAFSKLRDLALNVVENKPVDYYRAEN